MEKEDWDFSELESDTSREQDDSALMDEDAFGDGYLDDSCDDFATDSQDTQVMDDFGDVGQVDGDGFGEGLEATDAWQLDGTPEKAPEAKAPETVPGQLLTGSAGAPFAVDEGEQKTVAVFKTEDNEAVAWIDRNNRFSPEGLSVISLVENSGIKVVKTVPVEIAKIAAVYASGASSVGPEVATSEQQKAAIAIFADASRQNASDVHIVSSKGEQCRVLFRINGDLIDQPNLARSYDDGIQLARTIYNAMSQEGSNNFRIDARQDSRISKRQFLPKNVESIRVSVIGMTNVGHTSVMRMLYNSSVHDVDFVSLGYHPRHVEQLNYISRRPYGCCIISGPTGSGKSTSLKGLLQKIIVDYDFKKNVITVEDPCEYPIYGARQTSIYNATTEEERLAAYEEAITAALRHDPDVIMVGEIRDKASARLAFQAAKTGHLLTASLHANNAMSIPGRLLDIGIKPEDVYDPTLMVAMISQRLVKLLCPHCKVLLKDHHAGHSDDEVHRIAQVLGTLDGVYVCGTGCPHCRDGVVDRTVVSEIILPDEGLMALLRDHKRPEAMRYWQERLGGLTMNDHAVLKVLDGLVDPFHAEIQLGELQSVFRQERY